MITDAILVFFGGILYLFLNVLPSASLPANISSSFSYIFQALFTFDALFPITAMLQVFTAAVSFEVAVLGFKVIVWLYGRIRGVSGK